MPTKGDGPVNIKRIQAYFSDPKTVEHYVRAAANIGLWESERAIIEKWLKPGERILDLGCGAGRIALGLWKLGFEQLEGADLSEAMVAEARSIAGYLGAEIDYRCEDATRLSYEEGRFDGVVFGFNGMMQIPGRENRRRATNEIRRVLKPKGIFIFTTLDRDDPLYRTVFKETSNFDHDIRRNPLLMEMGDRHFDTKHGTTFMHVPNRVEVLDDLKSTGWTHCEDQMRSEIFRESPRVLEFSEDCRFWIAKKPVP